MQKKDWMANIQSFFMNKTHQIYALLFFLGSLNVLSYAPYHYWPVVILTLAVLIMFVSQQTSPRRAFKMGFSYGLGWFATGISWVHVAIADFGALPAPVSFLLMALLDSYLALFPALACYLAVRFTRKTNITIAIIPLWLFSEFLRGWLLTGFPWLSVGYTQTQGPLSGLAPIIGEFGLQFVIMAIAAIVAKSLIQLTVAAKTTAFVGLAFVLALLTISAIYKDTKWFEPSGDTVKLALVQGNIAQSIKWQPENELPTMNTYMALSKPWFAKSDVIIWPEAAIPRLEVIANDYLRDVDQLAAMTDTAVITGIVDYQPDTNLAFNNMLVLGKKYTNDDFGHYKYLHNNRFSKHHLLPIGEFVPFESVLRKLGPLFDLPMSSFSRGAYQQDNLIANGFHISPAICFEVAFSQQVRANLYQGEAPSDFIVTLSNDAWFGDSHGPWQHLEIAQMRALEYAKPVVRVTNNGVTAVVNEQGSIVAQLDQFQQQVLSYDLALSNGQTPYYRYGNLPIWLLMLLTLILAIKKPVE